MASIPAVQECSELPTSARARAGAAWCSMSAAWCSMVHRPGSEGMGAH